MSRQVALRPGALQAQQLDYILMDGSGSMKGKWWDSLAALDGFMEVLKAENVHSHGIVATFDSGCISLIQRDGIIRDWKPFWEEPIGSNWGGTPLYDAVNNMVRELRDMDPPRCSIVIITDGQDTSSTTTPEQARALLDWCRAKGWQVTFLGADFNNSHQAKLLGADDSNTLGVQQKLLADAGKLFGKKRAEYGRSGKDINFTKDEQSTFGGYLSGPSNGE